MPLFDALMLIILDFLHFSPHAIAATPLYYDADVIFRFSLDSVAATTPLMLILR